MRLPCLNRQGTCSTTDPHDLDLEWKERGRTEKKMMEGHGPPLVMSS
jgi:hypothetical protein